MNFIFFLQGIPETIGTIALSLAMARIPIRWGPVVLAGSLISVTGCIIKWLPVTLGLHSIAMLLLTTFFILKATRVSSAKGFITITASVAILIFLEIMIHLSLVNFTDLDLKNIEQDSLLWFLIGLPQAIILFIIALIVRRIKEPVPGGWKI